MNKKDIDEIIDHNFLQNSKFVELYIWSKIRRIYYNGNIFEGMEINFDYDET